MGHEKHHQPRARECEKEVKKHVLAGPSRDEKTIRAKKVKGGEDGEPSDDVWIRGTEKKTRSRAGDGRDVPSRCSGVKLEAQPKWQDMSR